MNSKINLLFLKDISKPISNISLSYLCQKEGDFYKITEIPLVFPGNFSEIWDFLCYDYDKIPCSLQDHYQHQLKVFSKVNENFYQIETKEYIPQKKKIK